MMLFMPHCNIIISLFMNSLSQNTKTRYLQRRLENIHNLDYDPALRVYTMQVTYQGSPIQ